MGGRSRRGSKEGGWAHGLAEDLLAGQDFSPAWRCSHNGNKEQKPPPNSSRKHLHLPFPGSGFLGPSHTKHFSNKLLNSGGRHGDIIRGHISVSFWELPPEATQEPLVLQLQPAKSLNTGVSVKEIIYLLFKNVPFLPLKLPCSAPELFLRVGKAWLLAL